jgi:hypothetical protein
LKIQKLNKRRFLGDLCEYDHRYEYVERQTKITRTINQTVRYKACRTCCTCNALSVLDRKGAHDRYRHEPHNVSKMKKYQIAYNRDFRSKGKRVKS